MKENYLPMELLQICLRQFDFKTENNATNNTNYTNFK